MESRELDQSLPNLTWSLAKFDFGSVAVGNTPSQTFTLTNTGGMSSGTITVNESGSTAFIITADGCTGKALGGSKSCTVTVEYAPTVTTGDTGTLTATGEHSSASLNLYGNGRPNLVLNPGTFINEINGKKNYNYSLPLVSGVAQTFKVSNTGTVTSEELTVENTSDPEFAVSNDHCTGTALAPNGTCTFDITFTAPSGCSSGTHYNGSFDIEGFSPSFVDYIHLSTNQQCGSV